MKLYNALLMRDILKSFIDVGDWSDYLNDLETVDLVFLKYNELSNVVSSAFLNTYVSKNEMLEEVVMMKDTLEKKVDIIKSLVCNELLSGNIDRASELCDQILSISLDVRNLDTLITKVLVSTDV